MDKEFEVQIDLNVTSYIPDSYISDSNQKIEIYQDIALCQNEKDIQGITDEIIDRFGDMPKQIENLLEISRIKQLAKKAFVNKISSKQSGTVFTFENEKFNGDKIIELIKIYGNNIKFSPGIKPMVTLKSNSKTEKDILNDVKDFLENVV